MSASSLVTAINAYVAPRRAAGAEWEVILRFDDPDDDQEVINDGSTGVQINAVGTEMLHIRYDCIDVIRPVSRLLAVSFYHPDPVPANLAGSPDQAIEPVEPQVA